MVIFLPIIVNCRRGFKMRFSLNSVFALRKSLRILFSFALEKLLNQYDRILVLTITEIKNPLFTRFAHLLITVLFVTPIILLTSIGVNS